MNNELLEQWRKEAECKYPYSGIQPAHLYNGETDNQRRAYIEGCKATHEKMLKIVEKAFNVINPSAITWDYFKKENNIS